VTIFEPDLLPTLDRPHPEYEERPFFDQTLALLRSVRELDFVSGADLHDADRGIVSVEPAGPEWELWFHLLFAHVGALNAATDSEILDYVAIEGPSCGYSVLDFRQSLTSGGLTATFDCLATITWSPAPDGWVAARWQASVISSDIPDGFVAKADA
jgi:hypothetical protein